MLRSLTTGQSTVRRRTQPSELDCGFDSTPWVDPSSMTIKDLMQNLTKAGAKGVLMRKIDVEGPPRDTLHAMGWVPELWKHARDLPAESESWEGTGLLRKHPATCCSQYGLWPLCSFAQGSSAVWSASVLPTSQVSNGFRKR